MVGRRVRRGLAAGVLLAAAACATGSGGDAAAPDAAAPETSPTAPLGAPSAKPTAPMDRDGEGVPEEVSSLLEEMNSSTEPTARTTRRLRGSDISWPQCPEGMGIPERRTLGLPMPEESSEFVIIGLTNGPAFTPNPCLVDQVAWARENRQLVAAYAVVSFPQRDQLRRFGDEGPFDGSSRLGRLRNAGYQAGLYSVQVMERAGLPSPIMWVDVEPVSDFEWSEDRVANAAVVEGSVRAYRDHGLRIGFYSTPHLWSQIVGDYATGAPEWRAAGESPMSEALERCGEDWSIQGGEAVMGQWLADSRDHNITCPGQELDLAEWFHRF